VVRCRRSRRAGRCGPPLGPHLDVPVCFVAGAPVSEDCAVSVDCFFAASAFGFRAPRLRGCVPGAACASGWHATVEAGAKRQGSWIACLCGCWVVTRENLVIGPDNLISWPFSVVFRERLASLRRFGVPATEPDGLAGHASTQHPVAYRGNALPRGAESWPVLITRRRASQLLLR
jgi:hypothetical protein